MVVAECSSANDAGQVDSTAVADGHLLIGAGPWNSAEVERLRVKELCSMCSRSGGASIKWNMMQNMMQNSGNQMEIKKATSSRRRHQLQYIVSFFIFFLGLLFLVKSRECKMPTAAQIVFGANGGSFSAIRPGGSATKVMAAMGQLVSQWSTVGPLRQVALPGKLHFPDGF